MQRLHEELSIQSVAAPASIATATPTKSAYVAAAGNDEIAFICTTGAQPASADEAQDPAAAASSLPDDAQPGPQEKPGQGS